MGLVGLFSQEKMKHVGSLAEKTSVQIGEEI